MALENHSKIICYSSEHFEWSCPERGVGGFGHRWRVALLFPPIQLKGKSIVMEQKTEAPEVKDATPSKAKTEWYKTGFGIVVAIVILPFFGIWWIWARSKMNKIAKLVLTGLISLFVIIVMISGGSSSTTTPTTSNGSVKTNTPAQKVVYDIPSYMGKNADEVKALLGTPKSTYEPNAQQASAGVDEGSIDYEKDGQPLLITYNSKTRAIIDFFLEGSDENKMYASGNLNKKSNDYLTEAVKQANDSSKITGLKASKKLASELDGSVKYNLVAFEISNNENYNWTECRLKLNDKYKNETGSTIKAKDKLVVNFSDFTDKDGTRFNFLSQEAQSLYVSCHTNLQTLRSNYFSIK